jgi:hypothetical protein
LRMRRRGESKGRKSERNEHLHGFLLAYPRRARKKLCSSFAASISAMPP